MSDPVFSVSVWADLDRDGVFETDLTERAGSVAGNTFKVDYGMDSGGRYRIGTLTLRLLNEDGAFTPEYPGSAYAGQLEDPGLPVKLVAEHDGIEFALFTGYVVEHSITVGPAGVCELKCEDLGYYLQGRGQVNVAVSTSRDTGEAIEAVLTQAGLTAGQWDVDAGVQALPVHFETNADAMQAFGALVASELGGAGFVTGNGAARFENRHSRLGPSQFHREVMRLLPGGFWRFREQSGDQVYDHSGNANHMTLGNSPTLGGATSIAAEEDDASVAFTAASSHYGTVADHATLDVGDTFSWLCVFKPSALAEGTLIDRGNPAFFIVMTGAGEIRLDKSGVGSVVTSSGAGLQAGEWAFVVVTKDGGAVHIWVNGEDVTGPVSDLTMGDAGLALEICRIWGGVAFGGVYFSGSIDEMALFDEALTEEQVTRLWLAWRFGFWGDDSDVTPCIPPSYARSSRELVSKVAGTGRTFREDQEMEIWRDPRVRSPFDAASVSTLVLAPGEVLVEDIVVSGTLSSLVTPDANVDYRANTANDGSGTDRTASLAVSVEQIGGAVVRRRLEDTHATDTIYVTEFRLRGVPLTMLTDITQTVVDEEAAPGQPAKAEVVLSIPWIGDTGGKLRDFVVQTFETYSWPYPMVTCRFAWETDATVRDMLYLEPGHLVRFWDRDSGQWGTYVADEWYIGSVSHEVTPGQQSFTTVTLLPRWLWRNLDAMAWDDFNREDASGLGIARSDDEWQSGSTWDVVSGQAEPNTAAVTGPYIDLGQPNHDMVLALRVGDIGEDAIVGLRFRQDDADNYLRVVLDFDEEMLFFDSVVAGVVTEIANAEWVEETTAQVRVLALGNRVRVYLGRKLVIDETVTALNWATSVGLYSENGDVDTVVTRWYAQAG